MAKAKKPAATTGETKAIEPAAPKAAAKKKSAVKAPAAPAAPMIDTGMAAETAAKMVGAKLSSTPTMGGGEAGAPSKESSAFKQMKDSLNKPASTTMANFLDKSGGPGGKKSNMPFSGPKQVGRNQTFGADVNRTGVPRRTGG